MERITGLSVFMIRWYLRVTGALLIGYAWFLLLSKHPSPSEVVLTEGLFIALGIVGILGSFRVRREWVLDIVSLLIALLGGLFLFSTSINNGLTSTIVAIGLDPQRTQFLAALLLTAGTALIGAVFGRRKFGACLGAGIVFWFAYLSGFLQLQLQPVYDPGGNLEALNVGALIHTSLVMIALASLCAFIGAAVGIALGEALLDPIYHAVQLFWQQFIIRQQQEGTSSQGIARAYLPPPASARALIGPWLSAGILIVFLILALGSSDLFVYSPDVGLHSPSQGQNGGNTSTQGTIVVESIVSQALGGQTKPFIVYLPPSYYTPQGQNRRYPTLYLLHGSPGNFKDWIMAGKADQSADSLIAQQKIPELIMVLPDGNGRISPSEWGNSFDQSQKMETFVTADLVSYIDQHFRTIAQPADRAIGGLSMGGFGAVNIAVHHPEVFGTAISLGGYYNAENSVWGNNAGYKRQNSPAQVLPNNRQAWKLHIFLGAATQDQPYYTDAIRFAHELDSLSIPYHLDIEKGYHSWRVWEVQMYKALLWLHWG
jgi:S-formylglutathione hydrolase FrmB